MRPRQLDLFGTKKDKKEGPQREGIIIPVDTAILLFVVIILLLITAFSWGVARGRKSTLNNISAERNTSISDGLELKKDEDITKKDIEQEKQEKSQLEKESKPEQKELTTKTETQPKKDLFRIQVASFKKLSSAHKEAEKLKQKGFPVEIEKKGKYSVVYVGKFEDEEKAAKNLKELKNTYKDCLLRRL